MDIKEFLPIKQRTHLKEYLKKQNKTKNLWKYPKCPSVNEWIKNVVTYVYTGM